MRNKLSHRLATMSEVLAGTRPRTDLSRQELKALEKIGRDAKYHHLRHKCQLRELPALALFPGLDRIQVPLGVVDEESGHANHAEMAYVAAAAQLRHARRIFEFGTFIGRTTLHLARMNPAAEVWTLDLPREANRWRFADYVGTYFAGTPEAGRIHFLRCDARTFDTAAYRGRMDFIWVDGDHSYEGVKNDTDKAFDMLAPGGAILWHDFGPDSPDVVRYFAEFTANRPLFHIARTSLLVHLDGIDPLSFTPADIPFTKAAFRQPSAT